MEITSFIQLELPAAENVKYFIEFIKYRFTLMFKGGDMLVVWKFCFKKGTSFVKERWKSYSLRLGFSCTKWGCSWSFFLSCFSNFLQISRRRNSAWLALSPFKSTFPHFCCRMINSAWNFSTIRSFSAAQNHALESKNMDLIFSKFKKKNKKTQKTWI